MEKIIFKNENIDIKELNNIIYKIKKDGGYREKDILNNLYKITKENRILKFYHINKENFFSYDIITRNIVG